MKQCPCCGGPIVRYWPFEECGACKREDLTLSEEEHERVLRACLKVLDPRLRSQPFFVPLPPKKPAYDEELS